MLPSHFFALTVTSRAGDGDSVAAKRSSNPSALFLRHRREHENLRRRLLPPQYLPPHCPAPPSAGIVVPADFPTDAVALIPASDQHLSLPKERVR